jgi:hypothetical protein
MPPVLTPIADFAAARAVDEDPACRHLARQPAPLIVEPDDVAVLRQQDLGAPGDPAGNPGMPGKLAVLTVYRHEVARSDQGEHEFQLFFAAVPGNMDVFETLHRWLGSPLRNMVHHSAVAFSLPEFRAPRGDRPRFRHVPVVIDGNPGSAACGSPWEPVLAHHVLSRKLRTSLSPMRTPVGRSSPGAGQFRVVDHSAAKATLRSNCAARSTSASGDARRERRRDLPSAFVNISSNASVTSISDQ